jgi:hypothetical protein
MCTSARRISTRSSRGSSAGKVTGVTAPSAYPLRWSRPQWNKACLGMHLSQRCGHLCLDHLGPLPLASGRYLTEVDPY